MVLPAGNAEIEIFAKVKLFIHDVAHDVNMMNRPHHIQYFIVVTFLLMKHSGS